MLLRITALICLAVFSLKPVSLHAEVTFDWVTIGNSGNAPDQVYELNNPIELQFGAVDYTYRISKHEVTNTHYTDFLNSVADTDTNALYSTSMGSVGGITRSGSSGSYIYSTSAGHEDKPVNFVSFWNSLRFANWMQNGQPTGTDRDTGQ